MAATSPSPASTEAGARPAPARVAFVGAALFVFTDGPLFFLAHRVLDRPGPSWHDVVVAGGLTATAATAGMLVLWSLWRTRLRSPQPPHPKAAVAVVFFALITAASTAWSVDALHTGWRSVVYVGLAMLAWQVADLGDAVWKPLALMAAAGVAASLGVVAAGTGTDSNGDWQGIYLSRNLLAPVAAIGAIAGVRLLVARGRFHRIAGTVLGAASLAAMLGAESRTAWLALGAGAGFPALPVLRKHLARRLGEARARAVAWTALGAGTAGAAAALAALWDAPTLAQRRTIWRVSWEQFLERPLHGHGFSAIWTWPEFLDNHELLDRGSAHSGPLEVALGLGVLGLVPFAVVVVLAVRNAGRDLLRSPSADTWMWAAVVAVMLIENITESFILRFSYNWVIVIAAALRAPKDSTPGLSAHASRAWAAYSRRSSTPATSEPVTTAANRASSTRRNGSRWKLTTAAKAAIPAIHPATASRV